MLLLTRGRSPRAASTMEMTKLFLFQKYQYAKHKVIVPFLRPYQKECIKASLETFNQGIRSQVVSLPVGSGKTVIFSNLIKEIKVSNFGKKQTIVLAHREEIIDQACNHIRSANPYLTVDTEKAEKKASPNANVVVASVQTLGKEKSKRLHKFDKENVDCIIIDEAHHSISLIYQRILAYFGALPEDSLEAFIATSNSKMLADKRSSILVWGCSATLHRHDGVALDTVFETISYERTLIDMWKEKWLCALKPVQVRTEVDISAVQTEQSDFVTSQLSFVINTKERNMAIVKCWKDFVKTDQRRSTLVFAVDVQHMKDLTATFIECGIPAASVDGKTNSKLRTATVKKFRQGSIPVLVNCGVFTEGTDIPNIDCIILARPTKSAVLFQQMLGRGLRIHRGKHDCAVLDCVDGFQVNDIVTIPSLLGLPPNFDAKGESIFHVMEKLHAVADKPSDLSLVASIEEANKVLSEGTFDGLKKKNEINRIVEKQKRLDGWLLILHALDWKFINKTFRGAAVGPLGYLILKEEPCEGPGFSFIVFFLAKSLKQYGIKAEEYQIYAKSPEIAERKAAEHFFKMLDQLELPPPPPVVVSFNPKGLERGPPSPAQMAFLRRLTGGRVNEATKLTKAGATGVIDKILMQKTLQTFLRKRKVMGDVM